MIKQLLAGILLFVSYQIGAQELLIHYSFDSHALDSSGNDYDGLVFGATYGQDRFGNADAAVYFDGVDDYVEFPNISDLKPELPVSFSFFIKYDDTSYENSTVFNTSFEEDINSGIYMNIQSSSGKYQISYGDGSNFYTTSSRKTYTSNSIVETSQWHHIAIVVKSESDMKIYVDCQELGGNYSGTGENLMYSTLPGNLGRHDRSLNNPADYFKGTIDDFKYWNGELSEEDISDLCNTLDLDEVLYTGAIELYPNPTNGKINIESQIKGIETILIYDSIGNLVLTKKYQSIIDLSGLRTGFYFIEFRIKENILRKKLIIK